MTDQERLDAIDEHKEAATNLTAGLKRNGDPEKPKRSELPAP